MERGFVSAVMVKSFAINSEVRVSEKKRQGAVTIMPIIELSQCLLLEFRLMHTSFAGELPMSEAWLEGDHESLVQGSLSPRRRSAGGEERLPSSVIR